MKQRYGDPNTIGVTLKDMGKFKSNNTKENQP